MSRVILRPGAPAPPSLARPTTSPLSPHTSSFGFRSTYVFTTRPNTAPGTTPSGARADRPQVPVYPSLLKQPFSDALEVLCNAFNLKKASVTLRAQDAIPTTIDMQVAHHDVYDSSAPSPTHALVVLDTPRTVKSKGKQSVLSPLIVPINAAIFDQVFNSDLLRHHRASHKTLEPSPMPLYQAGVVRLPTIVARVPHPPSLPLLVLFGLAPYLKLDCLSTPASDSPTPSPGPLLTPLTPVTPSNDPDLPCLLLSPPPISPTTTRALPSVLPPLSTTGLSPPPSSSSAISPLGSPSSPSSHTDQPHLPTGLLTTYLLPVSVIEEFPAFTLMAETFARTDDALDARLVHNQGLWRNVLLLAPQDTRIVEIVRTAWSVTCEAHKARERMREARETEAREEEAGMECGEWSDELGDVG